jgi:hypothetical protein
LLFISAAAVLIAYDSLLDRMLDGEEGYCQLKKPSLAR